MENPVLFSANDSVFEYLFKEFVSNCGLSILPAELTEYVTVGACCAEDCKSTASVCDCSLLVCFLWAPSLATDSKRRIPSSRLLVVGNWVRSVDINIFIG